MKPFMDENFLLNSPPAERLYHEYAEDMPIFDYHSHLPIGQILADSRFQNITQVWLYGDHYKWRAMRACGVPEELVSGVSGTDAAGDWERFEAWAKVVPQTVGNPLYHWTHLELRRYFGIDAVLGPENARAVYDACAEKLAAQDFSVRSIIRRSNVKVLCTTDDPTDDLAAHLSLAKEDWGATALPAWRPDKALLTAGNSALFNEWTDKLEAASGQKIAAWDDFLSALLSRHRFFHEAGCRLSDYGIERPYAAPYTESEVAASFKKLRGGGSENSLTGDELERYRSALLFELLKMDAEQDWTQQLHFGARRNNNSAAYRLRGPDTGYDSIGEFSVGDGLTALLDRLESAGKLTRTIIYVLNPADNDMIASIAGSFMDGKTPGKIQLGTAWWYNDHKDGMGRQLSALSNIGLLSRFVGMLTDSRSFLSYPRHEYFRRLLCDKLGGEIKRGELPEDYGLLGAIVRASFPAASSRSSSAVRPSPTGNSPMESYPVSGPR
ncbi:MAG: glucuronate isomerase, partial [Synergistaceae bacterium]|nr:glucuronate isomerase [Synergistaceae bacterium]